MIYYFFLFLEEDRRFKEASISSLQFQFRAAETRNVEYRLGEFRRQINKSCFKRNRIQHCQFLSFKFQGTGIRSSFDNHAHLSKAGARLFESRRKSSTLTKWIDSTMRVAAIGLHKQVSVVSVFAFEKEAFSTKEAKVNLFNDARFRLISSNIEQIHFLYSDVSSASDDDSEAFFRANSRPKIASICRSGFEILNEFHLGDLNCKEEDFDFPIFVDAVKTELHIFGIFQSRARKYQKNAICRFVKADLGTFQK